MPTLDGVNLLERKSSGTVLLESTDGSSLPILTIGSYGRGRVLVLATDYSWKWYMGMVSKNKGNWVYLRLMERMVRWLTKDPDLEAIQIIPPEQIGIVGEEVAFRIREREEKFSKGTKGKVSLSIFNSEGIKIGSQIKTSGKAGEFVGSFLPEKGGTYKVKIETPSGPLEESLVITGRLEDMDAAPDHEQLRIISSSTGGETFTQGDDLLKKIEVYGEKNQGKVIEEKRIPVWGTPYMMGIILVLLGTEWYSRRKWGLI
jgi:hypothetical protein